MYSSEIVAITLLSSMTLSDARAIDNSCVAKKFPFLSTQLYVTIQRIALANVTANQMSIISIALDSSTVPPACKQQLLQSCLNHNNFLTASACATALLHHWIARFGVPVDITSDRGSQFTSSLWTQLYRLLGVDTKMTTAYHPQANRMVERLHRQLKAGLKARTTWPNWFAELPMVLLGIRSSWRVDPGCSPAELVYGSTLRIPGEFLQPRDARTMEPDLPFLRELQRTMGRKETGSIDRLKSTFVTQVGTGDNNKPLSEQAHPRSSVTIRSNPTTGAAATATAASFTPPEDNPVTITHTGRIQRRLVRFR
ncbi:hypothetical protein RRG08_045862 [Elysia crispata]|uniref:Integrase catalytic domain-containing protein n=1 Tax=Elysia crispata TaxID=231223 RepID=A0AAE1DFY8_9GAST|nr:hypothetical protein RRG08_045862 [Elysia crispata]